MTNHRPELSVIIPAYNEEQRIGPTLAHLDSYLSRTDLSYEILVVDDGSTDGTARLVHDIGRTRPAVRCIESKPNRGKGSVVRLGMLAARGGVRLMYDADGAVPPEQIPKLVNPIRLGLVDIAIGSRYQHGAAVAKKQPFYRVWWSRLANFVVQRSLVPGVLDTQCGFKAFSAEAARFLFRRTRIDGWAFDLEVLALAVRFEYSIREVPVQWSDDPRSKINPIKDAIKVVREMLVIRRNLRGGVYDTRPFPLRSARLLTD
jgi:dolichyl-phosphate beta-glucosyltransferase